MKKLITLICLLITTTTYAFDLKSYHIFNEIKNSVSIFKQLVKNPNIDIDNAFYALQKDYEKYLYIMQYNNIDDISELYCENINKKYRIRDDRRKEKIDLQEYYNYGFSISCKEGMSNFEINYKFLLDNYGTNISETYKEWLKHKSNGIEFEDGFTYATDEEFYAEIQYLKNFIKKHPNFVAILDVAKELELFEYFEKHYLHKYKRH